jgi:hypothetical protein
MSAILTKEQNKSRGVLSFLFLVWPFFSFILAIRNFRVKSYRIFIVLFFAFYGFTLSLSHEGSDGYRHAQDFRAATAMTWEDYTQSITEAITRTSRQQLDIYTATVDFFFSRFTDSAQIVFFFHGLLFAFLAIKIYGWIYDEQLSGINNNNALLYFVLILFINTINKLPFIRFPIASWIYIAGLYQYLKTEKRKYLLWCALSIPVHFSFVFAVGISIIFTVFKRNYILYSILLLTSYLVPNLLHNYLLAIDPTLLGEGLDKKIQGYGNQDYISSRSGELETSNWYRRFRVDILKWSLYISFLGVKISMFRQMDIFQKNILSFLILFLAFVNFGYEFDSLGRRFVYIWMFFAAIFFFRYYQKFFAGTKRLSWVPILAVPGILFAIVMEFRQGFEAMSFFWVIGNFFTASFIEIDQSVWDVLN